MNRKSLFVYFQGHPEYGGQTLMKEYRRDVRRFLRGERETYPNLPRGYFGDAAVKALKEFQESVELDRREGLMSAFPDDAVMAGLEKIWHPCAVAIYRNWLDLVAAKKAKTTGFSAVPLYYTQPKSKRSVRSII